MDQLFFILQLESQDVSGIRIFLNSQSDLKLICVFTRSVFESNLPVILSTEHAQKPMTGGSGGNLAANLSLRVLLSSFFIYFAFISRNMLNRPLSNYASVPANNNQKSRLVLSCARKYSKCIA